MREILWSSRAQDDLAVIDAYWWQHAPHMADSILDAIEAAGNFLRDAPFAGPALDDTAARKWTVRGTRYILVYRVLSSEVEVLRVRHVSENWNADL